MCRECAKSFKGKQIEKGVAFPTCVSPNRYAADSTSQHSSGHKLLYLLSPRQGALMQHSGSCWESILGVA